MPTKTSPYNQPIPKMNTRPAQIIETATAMPGLATDAGAAAAAGGLAGAIPGVNLALTAAKLIGTGVSEGKEAVEQGATKGQAVLKGALSSVGLGGIYEPQGIKERQASEKEFAEATANVNQELAKNMAAQKSSVTMKEENEDMPPMTMAPLKQLSPYTASYSAYNMSAKQASMEPVMQKLSGASTLPSSMTLKGDQYKIDANKDGEITKEDFDILNKNK